MNDTTPDPILELGFGFWGSKTVLSSVELGVFSELAAAGAFDADALRERLSPHPPGARDFFGERHAVISKDLLSPCAPVAAPVPG